MWIKVTDKLPLDGDVLLAFNLLTGVNQAVYNGGSSTNGFTMLCWGGDKVPSSVGWFPHVSHWMPLPAPPKSDAAEAVEQPLRTSETLAVGTLPDECKSCGFVKICNYRTPKFCEKLKIGNVT